jgi:hypothetical protein
MDGKIATLAGVAALAIAPAVAGATPQAAQEAAVPVAATYADLLSPIPNASERLRIADAQADAAQPQLIEAQYVAHHHHHHHHNRYSRAWYLGHGYYFNAGQWVLRPRHHHHHHHHY